MLLARHGLSALLPYVVCIDVAHVSVVHAMHRRQAVATMFVARPDLSMHVANFSCTCEFRHAVQYATPCDTGDGGNAGCKALLTLQCVLHLPWSDAVSITCDNDDAQVN